MCIQKPTFRITRITTMNKNIFCFISTFVSFVFFAFKLVGHQNVL